MANAVYNKLKYLSQVRRPIGPKVCESKIKNLKDMIQGIYSESEGFGFFTPAAVARHILLHPSIAGLLGDPNMITYLFTHSEGKQLAIFDGRGELPIFEIILNGFDRDSEAEIGRLINNRVETNLDELQNRYMGYTVHVIAAINAASFPSVFDAFQRFRQLNGSLEGLLKILQLGVADLNHIDEHMYSAALIMDVIELTTLFLPMDALDKLESHFSSSVQSSPPSHPSTGGFFDRPAQGGAAAAWDNDKGPLTP